MKLFRTFRQLTAEMLAVSPRKAMASLLCTAALSATDGISLLMLMPLLDLIGINQRSNTPNVDAWFKALFTFLGMEPTLAKGLMLFVLVAAIRGALAWLQNVLTASVREDIAENIRTRVYRAIAGAQWAFLVTRQPSAFVNVLVGEVGQVGWAASQMLGLLVFVGLSVVYLGLAFHFSPQMAAFVLVCAAALAWASRSRIDEARKLGKEASAARHRFHTAVAEHIASMKTAKSYGAVERHAEIFDRLSHELRDVGARVSIGETNLQVGLELSSTIILAIIVYVSFDLLEATPAQLVVLMFIFSRVMPRLVNIYSQFQRMAPTAPIVDLIAKLEEECLESAEPPSAAGHDLALREQVRFEDVTFVYHRRSESEALSGVSLTIPAGLTTAIVGPSGAGKSTFTDLLIGLLSPTAGRIAIDDVPLDGDNLAGWRWHLSYVAQETFLFHDTVRANLEWARPGCSIDELWQALRLAAADEFVAALPQGIDSIVGERGVLLSGGERQRLSLARALLRRPHVLVLDEATSSLDSETERRIQGAVEGLHREMTIVIVTHRLSMISGADVIHVLDHGRLVESGSWEELLKSRTGRFRDLCHAQGIYTRPALARVSGLQTEPHPAAPAPVPAGTGSSRS